MGLRETKNFLHCQIQNNQSGEAESTQNGRESYPAIHLTKDWHPKYLLKTLLNKVETDKQRK